MEESVWVREESAGGLWAAYGDQEARGGGRMQWNGSRAGARGAGRREVGVKKSKWKTGRCVCVQERAAVCSGSFLGMCIGGGLATRWARATANPDRGGLGPCAR